MKCIDLYSIYRAAVKNKIIFILHQPKKGVLYQIGLTPFLFYLGGGYFFTAPFVLII